MERLSTSPSLIKFLGQLTKPGLPGAGSPDYASPIWSRASPFVHLKADMPSEVKKVLQEFLVEPMLELKRRPSHHFRSDLVEIGYALASGSSRKVQERSNLQLCAESIEYLHLGSLIVDDIQDDSQVRRNGRALHCLLGAPHALGVGNWLYFYALRLLSELEMPAAQLNALYMVYTQTVELAHYGQIMDLCVKIDQLAIHEIEALCHECSRLKTGSIVMLAMVLGALVGGADAGRVQLVETFGYELGAYLQRLNDLGNVAGDFDCEKKWEDLLARKPSFVWAFILRQYGEAAFCSFHEAVKLLPDAGALEEWLGRHRLLEEAQIWVEQSFERAMFEFCQASQIAEQDLHPLYQLKERIQKAYV